MAELARKGLSANDIQKYIDAGDRKHAGIGSTPVSGTASKVSQQQQRMKVRGGRPPEPLEQQVTDANASAVVRS